MTPHLLLLIVGLVIAVVLLSCGYWLYLDARDRAEMRRHEAAMAALKSTAHRRHQHDGRHTHSDDRRPE